VRVSPLYTAARRGSLQCCELLLDKTLRDRKANVNLLNENNENALFAILRFDISDNVSQVEIQKQRNEAMQIVQLLLDENIRIDCINKDKSTPLKLIKSKFGLSKDKSAYYKHIEELIVKAEKQREYHELMIEEGILPDIGKLFVCGHGGVGKTTLKDALQRDWIQAKITSRFKERCPDPGKDDYTPTAGIDVQSIKLPDGTKFSVWDYAGQAEFYVTHTMFLDASTATFIVVYKIADYRMSEEGIKFMKPSEIYEEQKKKVEYWLRFIRSTNAGRKSEDEDKRPHVILVASRADWAKEFPNEAKQVAQTIHDEVQETFKDDLKILDDVFVINCHNSQCSDMERLRKILKERKAAVLK
ncbi:uncharacterized protein LOC102810281, partial [Saccoglossus kowalevskii]|uniref:Death-associated protein kinase dapk-1-like n=1 Tax=Saccoglossus kowalevskii TaxID=10224 RepID=A0ABM0MP55_SACKO